MKIAIVGAEESRWTEKQKEEAKFRIRQLLYVGNGPKWDRAVLVSGRCHRGGVDIWAEEIADELELEKEIYPAEVHRWMDMIDISSGSKLKGYRSRNIQIAEACDVLFDIEPEIRCPSCRGLRALSPEFAGATMAHLPTSEMRCKRCNGRGKIPNRSGGTWTKNAAKRRGKETHLIVIK